MDSMPLLNVPYITALLENGFDINEKIGKVIYFIGLIIYSVIEYSFVYYILLNYFSIMVCYIYDIDICTLSGTFNHQQWYRSYGGHGYGHITLLHAAVLIDSVPIVEVSKLFNVILFITM